MKNKINTKIVVVEAHEWNWPYHPLLATALLHAKNVSYEFIVYSP